MSAATSGASVVTIDPIERTPLGSTTVEVSRLGLGAGTQSNANGADALDAMLDFGWDAGLRFVDRNQVDSIFTTSVHTSLTDTEAAALPVPEGSEAFHDNVEKDQDQFLTARLGRLFRREHWTKDE